MELLSRLDQLERLKAEGKDAGVARVVVERTVWQRVEDRVDLITRKDMKVRQTGKRNEKGTT